MIARYVVIRRTVDRTALVRVALQPIEPPTEPSGREWTDRELDAWLKQNQQFRSASDLLELDVDEDVVTARELELLQPGETVRLTLRVEP